MKTAQVKEAEDLQKHGILLFFLWRAYCRRSLKCLRVGSVAADNFPLSSRVFKGGRTPSDAGSKKKPNKMLSKVLFSVCALYD